jgi:hypothetical protein
MILKDHWVLHQIETKPTKIKIILKVKNRQKYTVKLIIPGLKMT